MRPFKFINAGNASTALNLISKNANARFLAGGTNLLDLMKEDVEHPDELINIGRLELSAIKQTTTGGISIGALGKNTDAANHPLVRKNFPLLTKAILAGASAQIRNMATNGGNLLQRTRCTYFYDTAMPCNKREPGSGCGAIEGINRMHAIFGWSQNCIAVYPSDMAVALLALNAKVRILQADGKERIVQMADFHRLPGDAPQKDNNLQHGDLITAIDIPSNNFAANSAYVKVRDRNSYAFALVSVAAGLALNGGNITSAHIAMGGVAHKPWPLKEAEEFLQGKQVTESNFRTAADIAMRDARPLEHNKFKIELGKRTLVSALQLAAKG